jgi:hypothetical protein
LPSIVVSKPWFTDSHAVRHTAPCAKLGTKPRSIHLPFWHATLAAKVGNLGDLVFACFPFKKLACCRQSSSGQSARGACTCGCVHGDYLIVVSLYSTFNNTYKAPLWIYRPLTLRDLKISTF